MNLKIVVVSLLVISAALSATTTGYYIKEFFTLYAPEQKELASKFLFQTDKASGTVTGMSMIVNGLVTLVFLGLALVIGMKYKLPVFLPYLLVPLFVASLYDVVALQKSNSISTMSDQLKLVEGNPNYSSLVDVMRFQYNTVLFDMISSSLAAGVCGLTGAYLLFKRK
jgi:hypothetical protein